MAFAGCANGDNETQQSDLTSRTMQFLDLRFETEVIAPAAANDAERRKAIVGQLVYLSGELDKSYGGHGRFGYVELTELRSEAFEDGLELLRYQARLPIALPKTRAVPESYTVVMPRRVDRSGLDAFNDKYSGTCGKAKYGPANLWYDFKPVATGCDIEEGDAVVVEARVAPSQDVTTDRRPEQERFWDDGVFSVVVVHGTDSSSSFDPTDTGVRQYLRVQEQLQKDYEGEVSKGESNSDIYDDWSFEAATSQLDGSPGTLRVTMLLSPALKYVGSRFDARYDELSADADLIVYAGHSGLSKNIKALAERGVVRPEHYQVAFFDGCSTYAYLDNTMAQRRIDINGAEIDPFGTKYLDLVVNAQPAPWYPGASNILSLVRLLSDTQLHSYDEILEGLSSAGMPLVAGEEDNPTLSP